MKAPARRNAGLAALAAVLIVTATAADARIGGLTMGGQMMHGVTMTPTPNNWTRGYGATVPPPYAPPCHYGRRCASASNDQGGGGTGGFNPGGGSGTKPIKKPSLQ